MKMNIISRGKMSEAPFRNSARRDFRLWRRTKENSILEMLTTLSAEVIGNLCSKSNKRHFWRPKIQKFSGGACPRTPLLKSVSGAWLSIRQAIYIWNPSMQKGWLRPWIYCYLPDIGRNRQHAQDGLYDFQWICNKIFLLVLFSPTVNRESGLT